MSKFLRAAVATAAFALATPAFAHVTLETGTAAPGSTYKAVLRVPHGCDGSTTLKVRLKIPAGYTGVKPMPKAGWTLDVVTGKLDKPYDDHGKQVTEGVTEVTWTGSLPDAHYDEFAVRGSLAKDLAPDSVVYFPITQDCEKGQAAWTEVPAAGQKASDLKMPAPGLRIVAAGAPAAAAPAPAAIKLGDLTLTSPWLRATPPSAQVAGGYVSIANTGKDGDALVGGSASFASRVEIHEMAVADGVMKMRELEKGLPLPAGGSAELKPGGYHIMFMGLKQPLVQGQKVKATLQFQKAGKVEVEFAVQGMAAQQGPAAAGGGEHVH